MNRLLSFFCALILTACGGPKSAGPSGTENPVSRPTIETAELPPLEAGTFQVTNRDFGELIELTGTPIETEVIFKPLELNMAVRNDLLIMKTPDPEGLIKFLSLPDLKLVHQVGTKGQGPGELLFPELIVSDEPDILCYLYDIQQEKIYQIDTAYQLTETGFPLEKKEGQLFGSKQFTETGKRDFHYVSNSTSGKGLYHYDPNMTGTQPPIFDLEQGFRQNLGWSALIGDFGGNRQKNRLVYAYKYFHRILFFDPDSSIARTIEFKTPESSVAASPDPRSVLAPTSVTHYWGISPQPESLYCLYSGRTPLQVGEEFKAGTDHIFIEQWDWNGRPLKRYRLDHWGYFCVDEANRTIYVAAVSAEHPVYAYRF